MNWRILSVHPWLDSHAIWKRHTVSISDYDADFHNQSLVKRVWMVARLSRKFDVCVLYFDQRFALIAVLAIRLCSYSTKIVLVETYPSIVHHHNVWSLSFWFKFWLYKLLYSFTDVIVVHSSFEISAYADLFRIRASKFRFVPYFVYTIYPSLPLSDWETRWNEGFILCVGRHRDLKTFALATQAITRKSVVVASTQDLAVLAAQTTAIDHLEMHAEVSLENYYRSFDGAALIVLPFVAHNLLRSLGHMAFLEAACKDIPIITSRTHHLADYATEGVHVVCYEPENSQDLEKQICLVLADKQLARSLTLNTRMRVESDFTRDRYVGCLLQEIDPDHIAG